MVLKMVSSMMAFFIIVLVLCSSIITFHLILTGGNFNMRVVLMTWAVLVVFIVIRIILFIHALVMNVSIILKMVLCKIIPFRLRWIRTDYLRLWISNRGLRLKVFYICPWFLEELLYATIRLV